VVRAQTGIEIIAMAAAAAGVASLVRLVFQSLWNAARKLSIHVETRSGGSLEINLTNQKDIEKLAALLKAEKVKSIGSGQTGEVLLKEEELKSIGSGQTGEVAPTDLRNPKNA
jgi:hypothetical protein